VVFHFLKPSVGLPAWLIRSSYTRIHGGSVLRCPRMCLWSKGLFARMRCIITSLSKICRVGVVFNQTTFFCAYLPWVPSSLFGRLRNRFGTLLCGYHCSAMRYPSAMFLIQRHRENLSPFPKNGAYYLIMARRCSCLCTSIYVPDTRRNGPEYPVCFIAVIMVGYSPWRYVLLR